MAALVASACRRGDWVRFLYLAIIVAGLTMLVQSWAQAHISVARVATLRVLEPVWEAFFGTTFSEEQLTARVIVGATLVLVALLIIATGSRGAAMAAPGAAEVIPVPVVSGTDRAGIVADSGPLTDWTGGDRGRRNGERLDARSHR